MTARVYVAEVRSASASDILPQWRKNEIDGCKSENERIRKTAVWQLLRYALLDAFGIDLYISDVSKNERGKVVLSGAFVSLSHKDDLVAVAVSDGDVGVDIEVLSDRFDKRLFDAVSTDNEKKVFGDRLSAFSVARIWTAKESVFKRFDKAFRSIAEIDVTENEYKSVFIKDFNAVVSVACKGAEAAKIIETKVY